jgi:protein transport protein SEC23
MSPMGDLRELAYGFDQETSAVIMAKLAVFKTMKSEEPMDVIKWVDRTLIKLVARFAEYKTEDASSFKLSREFSLFP